MADRIAQFRSVERIEMKVTHPARVQLAAQFRRQRRGHQLPRGGQIIQPFEQLAHPPRHIGIAHGRHALDRREVAHRHDAGNDLRIDPRRRNCVAKSEEGVGLKEELRDRPRRTGIQLALQIIDIALRAQRVRVGLGIGRHRNLERVTL